MIEKINQISGFLVDWMGEIVAVFICIATVYFMKELTILIALSIIIGMLMDNYDENTRLLGFATFTLITLIFLWISVPGEVWVICVGIPTIFGYFGMSAYYPEL